MHTSDVKAALISLLRIVIRILYIARAAFKAMLVPQLLRGGWLDVTTCKDSYSLAIRVHQTLL